ncbi:MAG: hypothetical protein R3C68_15220 [Myxococcota bacterium]
MAVEASGAGVSIPRSPCLDMYVNSRWAAILGYTPQELPKYASFVEWVDEQIHPEDFS